MNREKPNGHEVKEPAPAQPRRLDYGAAPTKSHWWVWLIVLGGLSAAGYFLYPHIRSYFTKSGAAGPPAVHSVPVKAATAKEEDMPIYLTGLGSVTALNSVTVKSRVDGQIMTVAFNEGQNVKEGQLLIQIDPRPYQAAVDQAKGTLVRDEALLAGAKVDLERYKDLVTQKAIAQQQVDDQKALVQQDEGIVETDKANLETAELNVTYAHITSPITGRIGLRLVDPGNIVHATDTTGVAVVNQLQPLTILFALPEDDIPKIVKAIAANKSFDVNDGPDAVLKKMDQGKALEVAAYDRDLNARLATGALLAVDNQIDPTSGTVRLKGLFKNDDLSLFPNQFVNARLLVDTLHGAVVVPSAAVQRNPQATFLYVVKSDQTVELRNVEAGPTEGDQTAITKGLDAGEVVVTDGVDKLQQGATVTVGKRGANGKSTTGPSDASTTSPTGANPAHAHKSGGKSSSTNPSTNPGE